MSKQLYDPAAPRRHAAQPASDPIVIVCAALVLALLVLARRIVGVW